MGRESWVLVVTARPGVAGVPFEAIRRIVADPDGRMEIHCLDGTLVLAQALVNERSWVRIESEGES